MKLLRYLLAIVVVCALSGIAKADPVDFHMVVVDPIPSSYTVHDLTSTSDVVKFKKCATGQLPSGVADTYVGCETFENLTGTPLTFLQLVFPDSGGAAGQAANCALDGADTPGGPTPVNFFTSTTCSVVDGNFVLDFSGGDIPVGSPDGIFTIAEDGVTPKDFPEGTLTTTPEPSSLLLMSTGALLLGAFFYYKRRNDFGEMHL